MAERGRWLAWDAHFLNGPLGAPLRERFGPVGIVVFLGFLSACKRNTPPGQFSYIGEFDGLSMMGLPALELVNEKGEQWELADLWRFLGQRHVTASRSRGDLVTITSRRWDKWQTDFSRQTDAERKRRSRAQTSRTQGGRSPDKKRTEKRLTRQSIKEDDATIDKPDAETLKPLADRWHGVLAKHGSKATLEDAERVVGGLLPHASPAVIDERIGYIDQSAAALTSASYLATTVSNWLAQHGQPS